MKICSAWLLIREMYIKMRNKYPFIPTRRAIIKKREILTNVGKYMEKLGPSYIVHGNLNGTATLENMLAPQIIQLCITVQLRKFLGIC